MVPVVDISTISAMSVAGVFIRCGGMGIVMFTSKDEWLEDRSVSEEGDAVGANVIGDARLELSEQTVESGDSSMGPLVLYINFLVYALAVLL